MEQYESEDGYRASLLEYIGTYEDWDLAITNILEATEKCAIMGDLFASAAQKHLLVADRYSGVIVLMSYDYLFLFQQCVQLFKDEGCAVLTSSEIFKTLSDKIQHIK
jgi:hypothetical protein